MDPDQLTAEEAADLAVLDRLHAIARAAHALNDRMQRYGAIYHADQVAADLRDALGDKS